MKYDVEYHNTHEKHRKPSWGSQLMQAVFPYFQSCLHILDQETGEWKYEVPVPIGRITEMTAEHDSFKVSIVKNI